MKGGEAKLGVQGPCRRVPRSPPPPALQPATESGAPPGTRNVPDSEHLLPCRLGGAGVSPLLDYWLQLRGRLPPCPLSPPLADPASGMTL